MTKREKTEIMNATLAAGGYFETKLERAFHGGEKFKTRLYTADRRVVEGFGSAAFRAVESTLARDFDVMPGSTWRQVWRLRAA